MENNDIKENLVKFEDDIYRIISTVDHKEIRDTLVSVVEQFPAVLKEARKYELRCEYLSDKIEDLENEVDIVKSEMDDFQYFKDNTQEETLDWESVMETFYDLKPNINPWEFEKLIKERYGNE